MDRLNPRHHISVDMYDLEKELFARFDTEFVLTDLFPDMENINNGYFELYFRWGGDVDYYKYDTNLSPVEQVMVGAVCLYLQETFVNEESILIYVSF